jgi:DNA-binding NtrC family response regulator
MNVTLVEDNAELCGAMEELLSLHGYRTRSFLCAIDVFLSPDIHDMDVLIADYYLPDSNGLEVVRHLREERPDLPVIMTTTTSRDSVLAAIRALPDCRLLEKPIAFEALLGELARIRMRKVGLRVARPQRAAAALRSL